MDRPRKKTPEQEVIAFLRSMLKLLEHRGLRYVDEQFGICMTAMATSILSPTGDRTENRRHSYALSAAAGLIEELPSPGAPGVPVWALRAAVMVVEEALQEPDHQAILAPEEVSQ